MLFIIFRPEKISLNNCIQVNEDKNNTRKSIAIYEVKTTLFLLKHYLKACEKLELVVSKADHSFILGSAFLRNLVDIIKLRNDILLLPVVDFLGEKVGEIKINVDFLYNLSNRNNNSNSHIQKPIFSCNHSNSKSLQTNKTENSTLSVCKKNLHMNPLKISRNAQKVVGKYKTHKKKISQTSALTENLCTITERKEKPENCNKSLFNYSTHSNQYKKCNIPYATLPQIKTYNDYSKLLLYNLTQSKKKKKFKENDNKSCNSSKNILRFSKPVQPVKNHAQISDKVLENKKRVESKQFSDLVDKYSSDSSGCEKIPTQPSKSCIPEVVNRKMKKTLIPVNKNVLNYLLGCDMTKEDEEYAINELKTLSPCQHLVNTFNELYQSSSESSIKSQTKNFLYENLNAIKTKKSLNFNFNFLIFLKGIYNYICTYYNIK